MRCARNLDRYSLATAGSAADQFVSRLSPVHGQFTGGVGGVAQWSRRQGRLERISRISSYQPPGVVSSESGAVSLQRGGASTHNSSATTPLQQRISGRRIVLPVPSLVGNPESPPGLGGSSVGASHFLALNRVNRQCLALQTSGHGMAVRSDSSVVYIDYYRRCQSICS